MTSPGQHHPLPFFLSLHVTGQQLLADDFLSVQYGRPLKEGVPCINMSHTHEKGINVPTAKHSMHDIANKLC